MYSIERMKNAVKINLAAYNSLFFCHNREVIKFPGVIDNNPRPC